MSDLQQRNQRLNFYWWHDEMCKTCLVPNQMRTLPTPVMILDMVSAFAWSYRKQQLVVCTLFAARLLLLMNRTECEADPRMKTFGCVLSLSAADGWMNPRNTATYCVSSTFSPSKLKLNWKLMLEFLRMSTFNNKVNLIVFLAQSISGGISKSQNCWKLNCE